VRRILGADNGWGDGMMLRMLALIFSILAMTGTALAQSGGAKQPVSQCQAIAQGLPHVVFARFSPAAVKGEPATISYLGHSTVFLATPGGNTVVTDNTAWDSPP